MEQMDNQGTTQEMMEQMESRMGDAQTGAFEGGHDTAKAGKLKGKVSKGGAMMSRMDSVQTRVTKTTPIAARKGYSAQGRAYVPIERYFTEELNRKGMSPMDAVQYIKSSSKIKDTDGRTVFALENVEVPAAWSQLAIDILVSKYFRKAGVPVTNHETSVRQVIRRVAHTLRTAGEQMGYFTSVDAVAFEEELSYLLIHQMGAFNSPVWFNLGLYHEYGIEGSGGNYAWDAQAGRIVETQNAYSRPQCSACFIQSVDDDLMAIFQLAKNEARLFKYGSGTGTNFSKLRGAQEKLAGGGFRSGLMSFLEVLDKGAGATKSGGTTRRAAKMVCLDMDHPEIMDFITWKQREERRSRLSLPRVTAPISTAKLTRRWLARTPITRSA